VRYSFVHGCVVSVFVVMTQIYVMPVMITVVMAVVVAVVVAVIMSVVVIAVVVSVAEVVVVVVVSAGVVKVVLLGDLFSVGSHVFATHRHKLARSIVGRTVRSIDDKGRD